MRGRRPELECEVGSEAQLASLMSFASYAIMSTSLDGTILGWNAGAERLYGYTRTEMIGRSALAIIPAGLQDEVRRIWERLGSGHDPGVTLETMRLAKDGTQVPVSVTISPLFGAKGKIVGMLSVVHRVFGRMPLKEELEAANRELTDFVERAPMGLHWAGPDGTILWVNQAECELLGYPREEYVGSHISRFHAEPDVGEDILRRLKGHEELRNVEVRLRHKDGSIKHVLISSNSRWEDGRFLHTCCFTRDITDVKRADEALRNALKEKDVLLREVHHRVKNTLQVLTSLFNLEIRHSRSAPLRARLRATQARVHALGLVYNQLSGADEDTEINLRDLLQEVCDQLGSVYRADGSRARVVTQLPPIRAKKRVAIPLALIASEAVTNSFKYAFPGERSGVVRVELAEGDDNITFRVADDGVGLGDPGARTRRRKKLGLTLMRSLATQLGGDLRISSSNGVEVELSLERDRLRA